MTWMTQTSLQPSDLVHRVKVGLPAAGRSGACHSWTQLCTPADGFASLAGEVASTKARGMSGCSNPWQTFCHTSEVTDPIHAHSTLIGGVKGQRLRRKKRGHLPSPEADGQSLAECNGTTRVRGQELSHLERSWRHKIYLLPPQGGSREIYRRRTSPVRVTSLPSKTSKASSVKVIPLLPQLPLKTNVPSTLLSL